VRESARSCIIHYFRSAAGGGDEERGGEGREDAVDRFIRVGMRVALGLIERPRIAIDTTDREKGGRERERERERERGGEAGGRREMEENGTTGTT